MCIAFFFFMVCFLFRLFGFLFVSLFFCFVFFLRVLLLRHTKLSKGSCLRVISGSSACKQCRITPKFMKWMLQGFHIVLSCPVPLLGYNVSYTSSAATVCCTSSCLMLYCLNSGVQTYVIIQGEKIKRMVFQ